MFILRLLPILIYNCSLLYHCIEHTSILRIVFLVFVKYVANIRNKFWMVILAKCVHMSDMFTVATLSCLYYPGLGTSVITNTSPPTTDKWSSKLETQWKYLHWKAATWAQLFSSNSNVQDLHFARWLRRGVAAKIHNKYLIHHLRLSRQHSWYVECQIFSADCPVPPCNTW